VHVHRHADNDDMRPALTARQRIVLTLTAAVAFGVAGGLFFGPVWGIAGAAADPVIAAAVVMACYWPGPMHCGCWAGIRRRSATLTRPLRSSRAT
jgi:hypothetical protein